MKKLIALGAAIFLFAVQIYSQGTGEIRGRLYDDNTKKTIPGAYVIVKNGIITTGTTTDNNGDYSIKSLSSGKYTLIISYMGYKSDTIKDVLVNPGNMTKMDDLYVSNDGIMINGKIVEIIETRDPIIRPIPITFIRGDEMNDMAGNKDLANTLSKLTSEIYVSDRDEIYFRGARNDNFIYIVDGVKSSDGQAHVPSGAIGTMAVYTGGVPAQYGDFTGGCIVIETKSFFSR
jgi:hypothetical protein